MTQAAEIIQPDLLASEKPAKKHSVSIRKKRKSTAIAKAEPIKTEPNNLLAIIGNAAMDPRVDVNKMKELLAIQREIERHEQERLFNVALRAAQIVMPRIVKDATNIHTKSSYATLENVSNRIDPIAHEHGFSLSFGTDDSPIPNHYRIVCDLSHDAGHTRRYFIDLEADTKGARGNDNKTPVQGVGSTMSYGRRYLKVMMFDVTISGEDNDGQRIKKDKAPKADPDEAKIDGDQLKEFIKEIEAAGVARDKVLAYYRIEKLSDLPISLFDGAIQKLRKTKGAK